MIDYKKTNSYKFLYTRILMNLAHPVYSRKSSNNGFPLWEYLTDRFLEIDPKEYNKRVIFR